MEAKILALDIGSTSAKGVIMHRDGSIVAAASAEYPTTHPQPGWVEQNAADWWQAVCTVCHALWQTGVHPEAIAAVGLSGQMEDTLLVDRAGHPLGPVLLYADGRAAAEATAIEERLGADQLHAVTGNWFDAQTTLAKLLWLQRHAGARLEQADWLLPGAKDFIVLRLTGQAVTDFTTAATTGLLDIGARRWAFPLLEALALPASLLPPLADPAQRVGYVASAAAATTGLRRGTPVFAGAGDAGAATVGAGAVAPGRAYCYLGTTGWAATPVARVESGVEGLFHLCHPDPRYLIAIAPLLNAGSPYQWARDQVAATPDYAAMEPLVAAAPPGAGGVIFLPYLDGERSPFKDPNARGAYFGLRRTTTRAELLRAVPEGVAYAIRHVLEAVVGAGGLDSVTLIGGGSQSPTWAQILADVCQTTIAVPTGAANATALGAAVSAGVGLGWFPGYEAVDAILRRTGGRTYAPDPRQVAVYEQLYATYRQLYPAVRGLFPRP